MENHTKFQSPILQRLVKEPDVHFLMARMHKHAPDIFHHSLRVTGLMEMLWAEELLSDQQRDTLLRSVLLHDIGIVHMEAPQLYETHMNFTLVGAQMLQSLVQQGRVDEEVVMYHHENLDGTGLIGVDHKGLSPFVRSFRIVDDFDKFSGGLYSNLAISVAMEDLYQWSGVMYDEFLLEKFHQFIKDTIHSKPLKLDEISRM